MSDDEFPSFIGVLTGRTMELESPYYDSDDQEVDAGPLFLGYPTSSLMAQSTLGIMDSHFESTLPVKGEPFCTCYESGGDSENCCCGEEDTVFDWMWDDRCLGNAVQLSGHSRTIKFHPDFSSGTAAVRGNKPLKEGQHYWEVKMTTHVYGTDMMIGVGTASVDLNRHHHTFCSFLGEDTDSWGISYTGQVHHNGESRVYTEKFGQGTVIGVHLDMWRGTLEYYMNRKPLGLAFSGLSGKVLYPMACSTAARSGMKLIRSCSFRSTLQLLCCQALRQSLPKHLSVLDAITMPPGLKAFLVNNMAWLLWAKTSADSADCTNDLNVNNGGSASTSTSTSPAGSDKGSRKHDSDDDSVKRTKRLKAEANSTENDSESELENSSLW